MKVLVLENHKAPVVVCQLWYRAGARREPWGKSGLAHVFEHLMFTGTETVGPQAFVRRVEETGGSFNAFTAQSPPTIGPSWGGRPTWSAFAPYGMSKRFFSIPPEIGLGKW
ncbi:MAG TPA: insulinase family protein [Desulfobacterales bacterium]|jgi:hypothetical protein|nr:insulinase family protein [Desulfobacterales bacterium]